MHEEYRNKPLSLGVTLQYYKKDCSIKVYDITDEYLSKKVSDILGHEFAHTMLAALPEADYQEALTHNILKTFLALNCNVHFGNIANFSLEDCIRLTAQALDRLIALRIGHKGNIVRYQPY